MLSQLLKLLADYHYQLDGVGNRVVATETLQVSGPYALLAEQLTSDDTGGEEQNKPAVAYNSQVNEYLVVWQDYRNSQWDIYGQLLDADGDLLGSNFLIMAGGSAPAVAYSSGDNAYLVVWEDGEDIWARPVSAGGSPGTTFKVYDGATFTPATQAAVAYSQKVDRFLVTWKYTTSPFSQPIYRRILARSMQIDGSRMEAVITVAEEETDLGWPGVSADDEGRFLVVWQDDRGSSRAIYGQRLNDSSLIGSNFLISDTSSDESLPDVAWSDEAGAYLVVWEDDQESIGGQRVDSNGDLVGNAIQLSSWDSASAGVAAAGDGWMVSWAVNGDGPGGPIGYAAGREVAGDGSLPGSPLATTTVFDEVPTVTVAGSGGVADGDYLLVWAGIPHTGGSSFMTPVPSIYSGLTRKISELQLTIIGYDYDPLYRLTEATYSGAITAGYSYVYDAVGNMSAYTETIGADSSSAGRVFNAANQLLVSVDSEAGTTSFTYDNNGNLVQILPPGVNPGEAGEQVYTFNQRNLLTGYQIGTGSSVYDTIAEYVYDGDGHRVQQVDYSGSQPITTTYTNDNSGLSQVLVSDDGTTQTHNLLGLSLIHQDDGSQTRTLLADGLGSVRVEMVGDAIDSATTYEPYGKLLARSGDSGTVYGYTGEQHDAATGLVYLRARYYNPNLKVFMSRDPFPGWQTVPASQHGYSYVHNNPVNLTDPSGEFVPPAIVAAVACAANPLCLMGGAVVVGAAWIIVGPELADLLAPVFTDMLYGAEQAVGQIARDTRTRTDDFLEQCAVIVEAAFQQGSVQLEVNPRPTPLFDPLPGPQFPQPDDYDKIIRVRHYSRSIDLIMGSMVIRSADELAIWVEYPITTPYEENAIQLTSASFLRPLDGKGGFVEFDVDLNKWRMEQDPNLSHVGNSKIIWLWGPDIGTTYLSIGYPLYEPNVNPEFYDWKGNQMR
jgi:RHS repeat-associated protein